MADPRGGVLLHAAPLNTDGASAHRGSGAQRVAVCRARHTGLESGSDQYPQSLSLNSEPQTCRQEHLFLTKRRSQTGTDVRLLVPHLAYGLLTSLSGDGKAVGCGAPGRFWRSAKCRIRNTPRHSEKDARTRVHTSTLKAGCDVPRAGLPLGLTLPGTHSLGIGLMQALPFTAYTATGHVT